MVCRECATTFQAAVPDILGKVRDVGDKRTDCSGEEEKRRHPAVNTTDASAEKRKGGNGRKRKEENLNVLRPLPRLVPERGARELLA